ncbi:MAG: sulfatase family protein, partial [Cellulosilyticaceae bacterium]
MKQKHIVVILCDQLRREFLNCYGGKIVPTPHIDALAQMGVVFDQAITQSPVCAPARACMMTGRHVSDHGVWTNDVPFRSGLEYLPERMNALGYHTCAFGKLHHVPAEDTKGFQFVKLMEEDRLAEKEEYLQFLKNQYPEVKSVFNTDAQGFKYSSESYYEGWIADQAMHHLKDHLREQTDQPFLVWISFQGPHTPYDPPEAVRGMADSSQIPDFLPAPEEDISSVVTYRRVLGCSEADWQKTMRQNRIKYCEMIAELDRQVGRIMEQLQVLGIFEETVFIFSSDHGDLLHDYNGVSSKGPFPYSSQLNIPLILANHPEVPRGKRSDSLVGNIDIAATALAIAGDTRGLGVSWSLIEQAKASPCITRKVNYSEFCDTMKLAEDKQYRFCYYPFTTDTVLFDKTADPQELHNLSGQSQYAEIEARFLREIIDFMILAKGIHIEAHDFVPEVQKGVADKSPYFKETFEVAYPI